MIESQSTLAQCSLIKHVWLWATVSWSKILQNCFLAIRNALLLCPSLIWEFALVTLTLVDIPRYMFLWFHQKRNKQIKQNGQIVLLYATNQRPDGLHSIESFSNFISATLVTPSLISVKTAVRFLICGRSLGLIFKVIGASRNFSSSSRVEPATIELEPAREPPVAIQNFNSKLLY